MPSFVGQPLATVTLALQDDGLRLGTVTTVASPENTIPTTTATPAPWPASIVVSQTPNPGEKVTVGAAVNFEVR
jgi:beta-lactam-binding protein with PASTA domain